MSQDVRSRDALTTRSRRSVLAGSVGIVGALAAGAVTLATAPEPAVAVAGDPAAFEIGGDPTVTSNDGRVESVYFSPEVGVSWRDFSDGVDRVTLTLAVGSDAGIDTIYRETLDAEAPSGTPGDVASVAAGSWEVTDPDAVPDPPEFDAVDGDLTVAFDRVDVTNRGDAVTAERLSDADLPGGETAERTLDVVYRADVVGGDEESSVVRSTTVDVAVTNPAGDAGAGGNVHVDAA